MQIEEAFRDLKSSRFGLSFEYSRTFSLQRLQLLLLIGALAMVALWLSGKATERSGQHRHYQTNTLKDHAVLSVIFVGLQVVNDRRVLLTLSDFRSALLALYRAVQSYTIQD